MPFLLISHTTANNMPDVVVGDIHVSNFIVDELLLLYLSWLVTFYIDYRDILYAYIVLTDCENHTDVEFKKPAD